MRLGGYVGFSQRIYWGVSLWRTDRYTPATVSALRARLLHRANLVRLPGGTRTAKASLSYWEGFTHAIANRYAHQELLGNLRVPKWSASTVKEVEGNPPHDHGRITACRKLSFLTYCQKPHCKLHVTGTIFAKRANRIDLRAREMLRETAALCFYGLISEQIRSKLTTDWKPIYLYAKPNSKRDWLHQMNEDTSSNRMPYLWADRSKSYRWLPVPIL